MTCLACGCEHDGPGLQCPACAAGKAKVGRKRATALPIRTEAQVQAEIVAWLKLHGWDVTVTSAHTHAKGVTAGTPDLYVRRSLLHTTPERLWVEVKRPGGKVSDVQRQWHDSERACGGTVLVAYGIEDLEGL